MTRRTGRLWTAVAIVAVIAVAGVLMWRVWQSPDRDGLSTFGGFAVAVIVPVAGLVAYLTKIRRPEATEGQPLGELADALAGAVMEQWSRAALERQLVQPEPIPVRWMGSSRPLAGPVPAAVGSRQFPPLPGLSRVTPGRLRSGQLQDLYAVYGGLGSGRVVLVGGAGSGKSGAAILLVLDALRHRAQLPAGDRQLVPVPVLLTVHGWDPGTERVGPWLAARLQQTYPLFAGKRGLEDAAELVRAAKVAVILDGFDEISEDLRPAALRALSDQADFRVVVLSRGEEMAAAAGQEFLHGAIALELRDVDPAIAADYLARVQRDPPPAGWGELISRLRRAPESPIARALSLPLTLTLVRDTYRRGDDVGELLDFCDAAGPAASRQDIEDYLLDRVLPAAYAPRPGETPPRYQLQAAQLALGYVAARMSQAGTRDLAWWQIAGWAPAVPRVIATGLVFGFMFLLGGGPVLALIAVPVAGLAYAFGGEVTRKSPRRMAPLRWRHLLSRSSLEKGPGFALAGGLFGGVIFWLAVGFRSGLTVGLVAAIGTGLTGILADGLSQPAADDTSPLTPPASWRRDQAFGLVIGLVLGVSIGLGLGLALAVSHMAELLGGLVFGILYGIGFGLVWGLSFPRTWTVSLAFAQLALRSHTPVRLLRFLDDARERNVLRTVGPVYQFRHARLQDRLAGAGALNEPPRPP